MIEIKIWHCYIQISKYCSLDVNFPISAFGFCEYEDPEATLRCMRLLNDWQIADKKLVVSQSIEMYFPCHSHLEFWQSLISSFESFSLC